MVFAVYSKARLEHHWGLKGAEDDILHKLVYHQRLTHLVAIVLGHH